MIKKTAGGAVKNEMQNKELAEKLCKTSITEILWNLKNGKYAYLL